MCAQILEKRKCSYSGVCTFAHSPEEKDMWMYMKNNDCKLLKAANAIWFDWKNEGSTSYLHEEGSAVCTRRGPLTECPLSDLMFVCL